MRKKVVGASWKMHKNTLKEVVGFVKAIRHNDVFNNVEAFLMPSFVFIPTLRELLVDTPIGWGSQTMAFVDYGAYTGEVSVVALKEFDTKYVEIGHAERREHFNETDEIVNKKIQLACEHGLTPVVCIGETKAQKDANIGDESIKKQLTIATTNINENDARKIIFAYEPVWAIGQQAGADAMYVEKQHAYIRKICATIYSEAIANEIRIIYGGSVKKESATELMQQKNVDGLFIGRFGLEAENFVDIAKTVARSRED